MVPVLEIMLAQFPFVILVPAKAGKGLSFRQWLRIHQQDCSREGGELKSLPQAENCLRPGVTFDILETIANQMSDNQFAERMGKACANLFQQITRFVNRAA
ncbi:MAG: hypothetical protein DDT27_01448 [Dehalococcoidia bacterium]|nr:hypothetical protein [Chloroflexota bacterium]